jgi:FkbM family methyltransferase
MITNTKVLFSAVLKAVHADCICDIGSRDGDQSLLFRHLCPAAAVLAFEANPINFKAMSADPRLREGRIELFPVAVSNARGTARFHVTDVDYSDPEANKGTSSLLTRDDLPVKDTVEVETCRLDELILSQFAKARAIGLWIDVEGAEYSVLEGISGIKDRVVAVQVETAKVPLRQGQRTLPELTALMDSLGFALCGSNIRQTAEWGDVVFVNRRVIEALGFRFSLCKLRGYLGVWIPVDHAAVFLKARWPAAYRFLRKLYLKLGT